MNPDSLLPGSPSIGTPIALTIAGSDSGGGAGIQADLKAFSALGVFGCSALSSLTAQNTLGVQGVLPIPPEFVQQQIQSVLTDINVGAIKTGMLATADIIAAVAESLSAYPQIPFVLDPVMVATSGDRLLAENAIQTLIEKLMPLATLITPNLHEAAVLLNLPVATNREQMQKQGEQLLRMGTKAVLMKGGHTDGENATDLLITANGVEAFSALRLSTRNTHGTGCTLASAIAAGLAKKLSLNESVKQAKEYLHNALIHSEKLKIGQGAGPVHHFYSFY
ncbi:MAG: bifunctional hydroxymethylpyrimidine kinase/phosphomethylpyrimidine kinase [Cellvibrio sp.]|uniref:bifunctional hydroxymethylpyrimidine kinase/phosphomethylpyrimidine kinase n=1 Tax=Cellvibrio sp. TaxID=1965322 RepID=UPI0031B3F8A2